MAEARIRGASLQKLSGSPSSSGRAVIFADIQCGLYSPGRKPRIQQVSFSDSSGVTLGESCGLSQLSSRSQGPGTACSCITSAPNCLFCYPRLSSRGLATGSGPSPPGERHARWHWVCLFSALPGAGLHPRPLAGPQSGSSTWGGRCQGAHVASFPAGATGGSWYLSHAWGHTRAWPREAVVVSCFCSGQEPGPRAELPGRSGHRRFIPRLLAWTEGHGKARKARP